MNNELTAALLTIEKCKEALTAQGIKWEAE